MSEPAPPVAVAPSRAQRRHQPHITMRVIVAVGYIVLAALARSPALVLATLALLILAALASHTSPRLLYLPLLLALICEVLVLGQPGVAGPVTQLARGLTLPASWQGAVVAALSLARTATPPPLVSAFLVGVAKLVCLATVIAIFSAVTQASELLNLFAAAGYRVPGTRSLMYLLSTTLAVLPSIQSDLWRSMDVAMLRGGGRGTLASPATWTVLLTDVLVRAVVRGRNMADAVVARGFRLNVGLRPLPFQRFRLVDLLWAALLLAPGVLCYGVLA